MLTAILVDDEASNLSSLTGKLHRNCPQVEIIACCENAQNAIDAIDSLKPDLVFLDIEMPVMNGFSMLQQLTYKKFELIFTTAYDHYAIKAIRFSALDYLLKPIEIEDLKLAVARAEEKKRVVYLQTTSLNFCWKIFLPGKTATIVSPFQPLQVYNL